MKKNQYQKLNLNYFLMYFKNFKTIVIKIGSSLLINDKKTIRKKWLSEFAKDVKDLLNDKKKCDYC